MSIPAEFAKTGKATYILREDAMIPTPEYIQWLEDQVVSTRIDAEYWKTKCYELEEKVTNGKHD